MSSITPLRFTGVSSFSADLQSIIDRATKIAALPVQQLQNQQSTLIAKKQSLTALNTNLQSLTSSVAALGELGRTRSLSVTTSNANRVTVINNGVPSSTSYQITDITSVAKAASETTLTGAATADSTPVDSDDTLELVVGDQTFALDLTGKNNLNGLRDAINGAGAGVTATVLNTGSNYYLSITSNATGAHALQVRTTEGDEGSNLLSATNQGANAVFKLNGLDVEQADNVVSGAIPGLTFTIVQKTDPDEIVTLKASSSRNNLSAGLQDFVAAYNATREKLNTQIGENAGYLSGDFLVGEIGRQLRQVNGYQGDSGSVRSLAALGIEVDKTGVMSFDTTKFYSLSTSTIESAFDFFGSESTGFGGLSKKLDQISNPVTGFIRTQQNSYDAADLRLQNQVITLTERITRSQETLQLKLQLADALLAGLQSQQLQLEASIKSVNYSLYGKTS